MKKLIFTMIYTIPVVLLVFVLGRNLTLDDNTLLEYLWIRLIVLVHLQLHFQ